MVGIIYIDTFYMDSDTFTWILVNAGCCRPGEYLKWLFWNLEERFRNRISLKLKI